MDPLFALVCGLCLPVDDDKNNRKSKIIWPLLIAVAILPFYR